jgi:hypothetical protein
VPTIIQADGFEIRILTNDHRPAHVHCFKAGRSAKVEIAGRPAVISTTMTTGMRLPFWVSLPVISPAFAANGRSIMAPSARLSQQQYDAARDRARSGAQEEARAIGARFSRGKLVLDLGGGVSVSIARDRVPGLHIADPRAVANVKVEGGGEYLRWPDLDVDHSVPILLADMLGIRTARDAARRAGSVTSAVKAAAVRANGMKGGRPRKPPGSAPVRKATAPQKPRRKKAAA